MDFLDSLDLDTNTDRKHRKCHRVRSWYLYEQYKSLENNQINAAQKLKNKSYQDKILREEIKERRARRSLCDRFGSCQSECQIEKTIRAPLSVNTDDLYESFCEVRDNHLFDSEDNVSRGSSQTSKEFKSLDNTKYHTDENIIKNVTFSNNLADDVKEELEIVKKNIAENINFQLETVQEKIECLEKFTKLGDPDLPENDSSELFEQCESGQVCTVIEDTKFYPKHNKQYIPRWSKLVAFAYESVQFNHGNFYNDYSSQIMLAVLLCDVLRRGISKMCHILQPYVSPIKYVTSDSDISEGSYKSTKRKSSVCPKCLSLHYKAHKHPKRSKHQKSRSKRIKSCRKLSWLRDREYQSEQKWQQHSKYLSDNLFSDIRHSRASEPRYIDSKFKQGPTFSEKSSSTTIWPEELTRAKFSEESVCKCHCIRNAATPILQLARYIESILKDIED